MEDLDELLSDLESVSNYSNVNLKTKQHNDFNSSPSSSTSSSISFNSVISNNKLNSNDFIQSINRIVSNDIYSKPLVKNTTKNKFDRNLNKNNDEKIVGLNDSTDDDDDLNELNQLLDDLDIARKNLAMNNSNSKLYRLNNNFQALSNYQLDDLSTSSSLLPSPSLSSPNSSKMLLTDRFDFNSTKSNTLHAANELEKLMASLTMYKNQTDDNNISNDNSSKINEKQENETQDKIKSKEKTPYNKNLCRACKMPINGQVITALGYLWHPDHFVCSHCSCSIGTSIFYEKDDKPYCEKDYIQLFSPKCASCNTPILDKMLTALNKSWHINCFTCDSCNKMLNDESFLEINNTAYCKDCYETELAPKCKRCDQAIVENFISALNSYFHPECFVCTECGMSFHQSSFYEFNNLPYCELHYHMKRGSLCANCQKPINGRCITAMNKKFHPEHFVCSFCLKYLNKGTFKEQNDKPYCHQCFQHLF